MTLELDSTSQLQGFEALKLELDRTWRANRRRAQFDPEWRYTSIRLDLRLAKSQSLDHPNEDGLFYVFAAFRHPKTGDDTVAPKRNEFTCTTVPDVRKVALPG